MVGSLGCGIEAANRQSSFCNTVLDETVFRYSHTCTYSLVVSRHSHEVLSRGTWGDADRPLEEAPVDALAVFDLSDVVSRDFPVHRKRYPHSSLWINVDNRTKKWIIGHKPYPQRVVKSLTLVVDKSGLLKVDNSG